MTEDSPARQETDEPKPGRGVPRDVRTLGFVSMFMDISSHMIHGLLPIFLVSVLGAGAVSVGAIEGMAEATASISKVGSGALSDHLRRRKPLALAGYAVAALSKPLFPLAATLWWVVGARFLDRLGKGIRTAPRDALIADITHDRVRGASFGFREALDSAGAVAGPLIAIGLMAATRDDIRAVFWFAVIPAVIAVLLLAFGIKEPRHAAPARRQGLAVRRETLARLGRPFWTLIAAAVGLNLAQISEAFMLLRAADLGLRAAWAPLVLVAMSAAYALAAYPAGHLSDTRLRAGKGRTGLLLVGYGVFVLANLALAAATQIWHVLAAALVWGLHLGMTRALLPTLVADVAPPALRGTAFGVFHLLSGAALLPASLLAGLLWDRIGAPTAFLFGAALTAAGLIGLGLWGRRHGGL